MKIQPSNGTNYNFSTFRTGLESMTVIVTTETAMTRKATLEIVGGSSLVWKSDGKPRDNDESRLKA